MFVTRVVTELTIFLNLVVILLTEVSIVFIRSICQPR